MRFKRLHFDGGNFDLELVDFDLVNQTSIRFLGVDFVKIEEIIPDAIALTAYSFSTSRIPRHLTDHLNLDRAFQYSNLTNKQVFYADGSKGFEMLLVYSTAEFEDNISI